MSDEHLIRQDMTVVMGSDPVPTDAELSVADIELIQDAVRHDNFHERDWCENVVTGCLKAAKVSETIARNLRDAAACAADDDLGMPKDILDGVLDYVDTLRVMITAARFRRVIPEEELRACQRWPRDMARYEKLLKEVSFY